MKPLRLILNIAEKASVAKEITKILGKPPVRTRILASKFNPVYEFPYELNKEPVMMRVTSVAGHVMKMEFVGRFKTWKGAKAEELFEAPIEKIVTEDRKDTVANLKEASKHADTLALWLDCDREGENIAYEVIDIVKSVNPDLKVLRARFSALTKEDIEEAVSKLEAPDLNLSLAVDARQEIDLRLGAIFTRFQTEELNRLFKILGGRLISYGPCQFPTMGFVAKRYMEIQRFTQKEFWTLELEIEKNGLKTVFESDIERCFDLPTITNICEKCRNESDIRVTKVEKKRKIKAKPKPLATVPFQKLASSKLKIDSDTTMKIAEKLYNEGYISYPRTETDSFPATLNLRVLVSRQTQKDVPWKQYAAKIAALPKIKPREGDNNDKSHPPIYPVKAADMGAFANPQEWQVYELITRHFLAACGEDAIGQECIVEVDIAGVKFSTKGLAIETLNYLEVYPYQQWSESQLAIFAAQEELKAPRFDIIAHKTQPPALLSESDLIAHMDNAGIGTDSTIHLHIKTVQTRGYVSLNEKKQFQPTHLGLALYMGHKEIGYEIVEPELRASMEKGMSDIARGKKAKETMVGECLSTMKEVFKGTRDKLAVLEMAVNRYLLQDKTSPYANASVVCYRCKQPGHISSQCPLLMGNTGAAVESAKLVSKEVTAKANKEVKKAKSKQSDSEASSKPQKKPLIDTEKSIKSKQIDAVISSKSQKEAPAAAEKPSEPKKACPVCGTIGRHPRNSTCSSIKRPTKRSD
jgi:DNA topoisomerase-3